ncbi:MAG: NADH:ubiquinone reductase (Na(+)-transporting) subunit C [Bacteroidales bacterium]
MKNYSNQYIFIFAGVMVIVVALILSFTSLQLKPRQERNERIEKMSNILASVNITSTPSDVREKYDKYITNSYVVNYEGEVLEDKSAFEVDLKQELSMVQEINALQDRLEERQISPFRKFLSSFINTEVKDTTEIKRKIKETQSKRSLPVFEAEINGNDYYVFPLRGKGLWGPLWGYISLESDFNTVYGAIFAHKAETPGLGAEIQEPFFQEQFKDKEIFDAYGKFVSIAVEKGGTDLDDPHAVDAISGGTITSQGLEAMLIDFLGPYRGFINEKKN